MVSGLCSLGGDLVSRGALEGRILFLLLTNLGIASAVGEPLSPKLCELNVASSESLAKPSGSVLVIALDPMM